MNNNDSHTGFSVASSRVLACLAEPGAFARRSRFDGQKLLLFRTRHKMTLGAGEVAEADCAALIAAGLVAWTKIGTQKHLVISAAGLSARHQTPGTRPLSQTGEGVRVKKDHQQAEPEGQAPFINLRESPLAWLHRRKTRDGRSQISDIQFMAGERLRRDLELGQMLPRVTANWSSPVSGSSGPQGPASASDTALAARERVNKACSAVSAEFSGLLIDVCGFLKGLEQIEAERDWPARSAKLLLRMGLDRLAHHYGMTVSHTAPSASDRPRVWHATGARPSLLPPVSPLESRQASGGRRP
jgi:hypothetical protein